jgi:uncharacterized repeat protein (TIGR04002 family)
VFNLRTENSKKFLRQVILASLFAAMTTVLTYYLKIPTQNGYMHIGDSIIYLAACFLPTPLAVLSAGIGGMMADCFGGYTMYMIPTFIIKALLTLSFDCKSKKVLTKRNGIATGIAACITTVGYYITDVILVSISSTANFAQFKDYLFSSVAWAATLYSIPGNIIQAAASTIVFIVLAAALDKANIKSKLI